MSDRTLDILLVDDEDDHVELIRRALQGATFKSSLTVVNTLADAERALRDHPPHIVVCDYRLPDGEGISLLPGSGERTLPIVILTGHGDERVAAKALKAGAMDYIVKTDETLADVPHIVGRAMRQWQHILETRQFQESLNRAESIVSASSDMLGMLNRDYVYLAVNPAYAAAFGMVADELIGHSVAEVFGEPLFQQVIKPHADRCLSGERVDYQRWFDFPAKGRRYMDVHYVPQIDANGEIAGFVVNKRDMTEHRLAEEGRIRIEAMADQASDVLFLCDDREVVVYANCIAERLTGVARDQLIGKPLVRLFDEHCRSLVYDNYQAALKGEPRSFELAFRTTAIPCEFRIQPYRDTSGEVVGVLGAARDIRERKVLEGFWKRYSFIVNASQDFMNLIDRDYLYLTVNDAFLHALGKSRQEVVGKTVADIWGEETFRAKIRPLMDQCFSGQMQRSEFEYDSPSSGRRHYEAFFYPYLDAEGEGVELVAVVTRDITERKLADEALKSSEGRFRQLAENIREVFWIGAPDWNEVFYISPAYEETWGRSCQSLYDAPRSWLEAVHEDDREMVISAMRQRSGADRFDPAFPEYRIVRPDGMVRWILARAFPVRDEAGEICRIAGIAEDITERKQVESALLASEAKYRTLFENMMNGFALHEMVYDEQGSPVDYLFLEVNHVFERMTGLKREEIIGRGVREVLPGIEHDPADWIGRYGQVSSTGNEMRFEQYSEVLHKWYSVLAYRPSPGTFATVFEDITERRQVEETLRQKLGEFERMNRLMVGRELKMEELRRQCAQLQEEVERLRSA